MKFLYLLICLLTVSPLVATNAPDFTVTSSDHVTLKLYQNYINQGKLVVLEAFFTTCPPCNTHAPLMENLYTQLQAQYPGKVEFILLSTLSTDTNVKVATYKTNKGLTMPACGADGNSQTALQPYTSGQFGAFQGTPTFVVIAPNTGEMFYDIRGNSASETMGLLQQKVDDLLATPCNVFNFFGGPLEEANIHIQNSNLDTTIQSVGTYSLKNFPQLQGQSSVIRPKSDLNPTNGVTTYDLVLISKHILGIQPLLCDWQKLAADVNCSGSITTLDVVLARKVILGILPNMPCGSYRFVPDSIVTSTATCQDFYGVKIGDVNGNTCDQSQGDVLSREPVYLGIPDKMLQQGERYEIQLRSDRQIDLEGLQAEFDFNQNQLKINEIRSELLPDFDENSYALSSGNSGTLSLAWLFAPGKHINPGTSVLTLDITALSPVRLPDALWLNDQSQKLPAQAYTTDNRIHNLTLRLQSDAVLAYPNPATDRLSISTTLPAQKPVLIQLLDSFGKTVFETTREGISGTNEWTLETGRLPAGVYFLKMDGQGMGKIVFE